MSYIPGEMRRAVTERASGCCEYCLLSHEDSTFSFQIDHIIAEKHRGKTEPDNLALSCPHCNVNKGSDIASRDPNTGRLTPLYNPRTQSWEDHFQLENGIIFPLTPEGRVTELVLKLNAENHLKERLALMALNRYPC